MLDRMKNSLLLTQSAEAKLSMVALKPDSRHPALSIRFLLKKNYLTVGLMVES